MAGTWSKDEVELLKRSYLSATTNEQIGALLGRTWEACEKKASRLGLRYREREAALIGAGVAADEQAPQVGDSVETDLGADSGRVVIRSTERIETAEQALAKANINPAEWEVERIRVKSYEAFHKDDDGNAVVTPLWAVSAAVRRRVGMSSADLKQSVIDAIRKLPAPKSKAKRRPNSGVLAEISIVDHHFGKLAWKPETGEDYDLRIATDRFNEAADRLLEKAAVNKVGRILLPIGNDFYHVDSGKNTTTKGTPQDCDGRWQKAYLAGLECLVRLIDFARKVAPVDVVVVPGNHDEERAFTLGVAIDQRYHRDSKVAVDNRPALKKAYAWGRTFLGFYHGHDARSPAEEQKVIDALKEKSPAEWANATWRELHMGHLHSEREEVWRHRASTDVDQVIVRRLPSLSGTDKWHAERGYRSLKAAECHFFDSEHGRVGYAVDSPRDLVLVETNGGGA